MSSSFRCWMTFFVCRSPSYYLYDQCKKVPGSVPDLQLYKIINRGSTLADEGRRVAGNRAHGAEAIAAPGVTASTPLHAGVTPADVCTVALPKRRRPVRPVQPTPPVSPISPTSCELPAATACFASVTDIIKYSQIDFQAYLSSGTAAAGCRRSLERRENTNVRSTAPRCSS